MGSGASEEVKLSSPIEETVVFCPVYFRIQCH